PYGQASTMGCPDTSLCINVQPDELLEHFLVQPDDPIFNHRQAVFLELTEAVPLQRLDLCAQMLQEIQARGVHVVVDDLGSGYSNLRYLADLKPRVVKLDRELITGLRPGSRRFTLVRALVGLCNELGAMVVAAWLDTAAVVPGPSSHSPRYRPSVGSRFRARSKNGAHRPVPGS